MNEIWADAVVLAANNASTGVAPKPLCAHLVRMGDLGNVPRQEKKFKVSHTVSVLGVCVGKLRRAPSVYQKFKVRYVWVLEAFALRTPSLIPLRCESFGRKRCLWSNDFQDFFAVMTAHTLPPLSPCL